MSDKRVIQGESPEPLYYVVLDLEWNQCPEGKSKEDPRLPFEIIEIGAVKLTRDGKEAGRFHRVIKPAVYRRLHFRTKKVISLSEEEITKKGVPFRDAANEFLEWCGIVKDGKYIPGNGRNMRFATWGALDLFELQRNLCYYRMGDLLPGPLFYVDVQKIFAIAFEDRKNRRSLSYAAEKLGIGTEGEFHQALTDAVCAAGIAKTLPEKTMLAYYSVDSFRVPGTREEELSIVYPYYRKYISRRFASPEEMMKDRKLSSVYCFSCGRRTKRLMKWTPQGSGNRVAVGICPEHGYNKSKIRTRRAFAGGCYAVKTTRIVDEKTAKEWLEKEKSGIINPISGFVSDISR